MTPTFLAQVNRELAIEHLASTLKDHAGAPNPIDSFLFWHTIRREIALNPYGVLAGVKSVFNPYLDHDVYDLLASLPARMFLDHQFHDDAMRRAYPQYAALPFRQADAAPRSDAVHATRLALELAWFGLSHRRSRFVRPQALIQRMSRELRIRALYLLQLECLVRRRAAADLSGERIGPLKQQGA